VSTGTGSPELKAAHGRDAIVIDEPWLSKIVAADAVLVTDERQAVRAWSGAAERLLGYREDEVLGLPCYKVMTGGRRPDGHPVCDLSCPVTRNARRGRGTAPYEVTALAKDGTPLYLTSTVLVLEGPRGSFRVVHIIRESCDSPPLRTTQPAEPPADRRSVESLTRRELEILRLLARGKSLDDIAGELSVSVFTVRNHATNIQHKLGVRNRLQMVLEGIERGLV
jgi:PAS domain S-box-containing protein